MNNQTQIKQRLDKLVNNAKLSKKAAAEHEAEKQQARHRIAGLKRELAKAKESARENSQTTRAQVAQLAKSLHTIEDETERERKALQKVC
jgi:hypothetical protein